jgi:hypothetical protein
MKDRPMKAKIGYLAACAMIALAAPSISNAQTAATQVTPTPAKPGEPAPKEAPPPTKPYAPYKVPHNAFGQPDLDGTWSNTTLTRMERDPKLGTRQAYTPEEVYAIEHGRALLLAKGAKPTDPNATTQEVNKTCDLPGFPATADCAYNVGWTDAGNHVMRVNGEARSSFITFPADGRIPWKEGHGRRGSAFGSGTADNPEDRSLPERCLVSQNITTGAIMNPTLYNNTYVFQQSPTAVAIVVEMAHDVRMVRLNAKHIPAPRWFGDSIGHYEGDTLVVETTNFAPEQLGRNSSQLKVTERFRRVAPDRLLYQFRVEDPAVYTQPWGGEYEFRSSTTPQYEYACHEGNYGLQGILSGARAEEKNGGKSTAIAQQDGAE